MAKGPEASGRVVAVSTVLFDGYPIEMAIEEIARSGAGYIEPAFIKGYVEFDESTFAAVSARRLRTAVEAAGIGVHAVSVHMDLASEDALPMLERRIDFAEEIGASVLITNSGKAAARDRIAATIMAQLPRLEKWGGLLALENPGHGGGDLMGTAADGQAFVAELGSGHVRLNHDAANVFTYSGAAIQPANDWRRAASAIGHAHLKDVRSTSEGWSFCPLGAGDVDLCSYLAAIPATLPLTIELPLRLQRPQRADPVRSQRVDIGELRAALAQSLRFLANPQQQ